MNRIATSLVMTVLLLAGAASAQFNDQKISAKIPFDFVVGQRTLPAGQYVFLRTGNNQMLVRTAEGQNLLTVVTGSVEALKAPLTAKLRFETVNGNHVLVQLWNGENRTGRELYYQPVALEEAHYPSIHGSSAGRR